MDEEQLVRALRSQDTEAVEELVASYGDRLFRSACLICGSELASREKADLALQCDEYCSPPCLSFSGQPAYQSAGHAPNGGLLR